MKNKKIIIFLTTFTIVMVLLSITVLAMHPDEVLIDDANKIEGADELISFGGRVVSFIQIIGSIASIIILMALGIKYMLGSAEEKAGYKKSMIPFLVGALMLFSTSTVPTIVDDVINGKPSYPKMMYMSFCPKGHEAKLVFKPVTLDNPVAENAYKCTNQVCNFHDIELSESFITYGYGCPKCHIKIDNNYCKLCKKYYEI